MVDRLRKTETYRIVELVSIVAFVVLTFFLFAINPQRTNTTSAAASSDSNIEAMASAMPAQGWAPLQVYFSALGSGSADGSILTYEWDLDGNGVFDTTVSTKNGYANYTYSKPGQYIVTLQVTDANGNTARDSVLLEVRHPASSSVNYDRVFDQSTIGRVDFILTQQNWNLLWQDIEAKQEVRADAVIFGKELSDVGLKMRGQFSLRMSGLKKPWELNTDTFVPEQEYENLKQLMFINNIYDPSLLKSKLAFDTMQFAGVPASHTSFVEIWIDVKDDDRPAEYWGVYTMMERVDSKFIGNRYGPEAKGGNLYKASNAKSGPMDLVYRGPAIEDYPTQNGFYPFNKVSNEEENDYSDVIGLCYVISGASYAGPEQFAQELEKHFNVDTYLRSWAVKVTLNDWDSYPYTGNNYYLYNNPTSGKFEWIPWDLTWGESNDFSLYSLQGEMMSPNAPLYNNVSKVERYKKKYTAYLDLLSRFWFTGDNIGQHVKTYSDLIYPKLSQAGGDKMFSDQNGSDSIESFTSDALNLVQIAKQRSNYILNNLRY